MKKLILGIVLLLQTTLVQAASDTTYINFIKNQNPYLSDYKAKDILRAVKYYAPRYFTNKKGGTDEGIIWTLSFMAHESSFRNVNGDEGLSIGYMQIQYSTCNLSRRHNGIKRKMNLINRWDNIHCGMGELNRLYEKLDGDWNRITKAYNGGLSSVLYPKRYRKANRMTDVYQKYVMKKRTILRRIIGDLDG